MTGKPGPALDPPLRETWAAMERLVDAGLVRHLGVSNFSPAKMAQVLGFATKPLAICQCERHPQFRNDKARHWARETGAE